VIEKITELYNKKSAVENKISENVRLMAAHHLGSSDSLNTRSIIVRTQDNMFE
jgi:hypothetical protein